MADDLSVTPGTGATIAADDISGKLHQRVKLTWGVDGAAVDASTTNPLPVEVRSDGAELCKAEDAAHSTGDRGIMALAVRKDNAAALAGTDGDYIPLITDASGRLHVTGPTVATTGATDDAAATGELYPIAGLYQATADAIDNGDIGRARITARRAQIMAVDFQALTINSGAPTPSGSDITELSGAALASTDFSIRDTNWHTFIIPMGVAGWRSLRISLYVTGAFDQAGTFEIINAPTTSTLIGKLLSVALPASGVQAAFQPFAGAGATAGEVVGGATIVNNAIYTIPALSGSPHSYIACRLQFAVAPTTGTFTLYVNRKSF